eukprot:1160921-Pelagomonas_calceolata.AAC.13
MLTPHKRRSKLDSGVDAAALAWSLGYINYKPDAATAKVGTRLAEGLLAGWDGHECAVQLCPELSFMLICDKTPTLYLKAWMFFTNPTGKPVCQAACGMLGVALWVGPVW